MAALSDLSLGLGAEGTPLTLAVATRWWEVMEPAFKINKNVKQGKGMRVGTRVDRSARRTVPTIDGSGSFGVELVSKGMGLLFESLLGVGAATLVSGTTYQHLFTLANGVTVPSRTLQTGVVDATGTVNAVSYIGSAVDTWELELPNDDIAAVKTSWDCANYSTAQAYAAPSYAAAPTLFTWANVAITLGGAVTAPTTTALATGGTANTAIRNVKISGDNQLIKDRFNSGGGGRKSRQLIGDAGLTGELEIEYIDNVVRDAYLADTELPLTITLTSAEALSSGFAQVQVVLPAIKLDGEIPEANNAELPLLKVPFTILDNSTAAQPIWIVTRTSDAAL